LALDYQVKPYQFAIMASICFGLSDIASAGDYPLGKTEPRQEMKQETGKGIRVLRWLRPCQLRPGKRTFKSWRWCPAG
jgi:hypothetical protein